MERMGKLRDILRSCVDGVFKEVTVEKFVQCFPDLQRTHRAMLEELYTQFTSSLAENIHVCSPPTPRARVRVPPCRAPSSHCRAVRGRGRGTDSAWLRRSSARGSDGGGA